MNEATNLLSNLSGRSLSGTGTVSNLYSSTPGTVYSGTPSSATTTTAGDGITLLANASIHYAPIHTNKMTPKQVNVAVFTITRDVDTNEINSTKFLKQLWIEQKNGTSIDLLVAKQLGNDFDPETTIIKVLSTVSF
jgi:hypothetical protein